MSNELIVNFDLVILSNAPGEVATWVRPVVRCLRQQLGRLNERVRISVLLSPCPHSTGKEAEIALNYPEVDRVLSPDSFFSFLLWGKTPNNWQWCDRGMVVFLGGDQFYTVAISKRLNYSSLIYAEWEARWYRFIDRFAVADRRVLDRVPQAYRQKFSIVGDLMADTALEVEDRKIEKENYKIGLLVGSKPAKLSQGVPLCIAIAESLASKLTEVTFIIPLAPTLDLTALSKYAKRKTNPLVAVMGNVEGDLITSGGNNYLITSGGVKIKILTKFPAYQDLVECQLCLTTVGANTAELTSLAVPMIVLLPTQQLDAMRSWDGLPGILANLPGVGTILAKLINWLILKQGRLFAWPNIWAGREIVPELVGRLEAENVANLVCDFLENPLKLQTAIDNLIEVRGQTGAVKYIADIIKQDIKNFASKD